MLLSVLVFLGRVKRVSFAFLVYFLLSVSESQLEERKFAELLHQLSSVAAAAAASRSNS